MSRGLADLGDKAYLKVIWKKRLRTPLRRMRLAEFELCHDALEYAAFDWELDAVTENLSSAIRAGDYRANASEVVRGAKSVGLTRPLSFIPPRDLLVYIALVGLLENPLLSKSFAWVRFGRAQGTKSGDSAAESGWFRMWLKRQGQIWTITSTHEWIVESDVANFFGSISIDAVSDHVLKYGDADPQLVGLLRHQLSVFAPMSHYQRSRVGGLPQENHDGSRLIAHTILHPLDEEFEPEGKADLYSRWVDDVVIGADTWPEALQLVRRMQRRMEQLDLYPNTAKTRIIRQRDFANDLMKDENDYIGDVALEIEAYGHPKDPAGLRRRIQTHARGHDRRKAWDRVLRRYYTLSRSIGETALMSWWDRHLAESPGSTPHILEYLATFRVTKSRLDRLRASLASFGGTYEDVELLAREYALIAPNVDNASDRNALADWGIETVDAHLVDQPFLAAAGSLLAAKFGYDSHIQELERTFRLRMTADSACRQQVAATLYSLGRVSTGELLHLLNDASSTTSQHVRFLTSLDAGHNTAFNLWRGVAQPVGRQSPDRNVIRPRGLMLLPLMAGSGHSSWPTTQRSWFAQLRGNPLGLRDAAAERWLTGSPV